MAGDFNASCLELDNGRWNLYKSRELRYFVERNHLKHILDVDKAPICKCTFTGSKTLFDYIFSDTHMYMSLRSYEILDEGIWPPFYISSVQCTKQSTLPYWPYKQISSLAQN